MTLKEGIKHSIRFHQSPLRSGLCLKCKNIFWATKTFATTCCKSCRPNRIIGKNLRCTFCNKVRWVKPWELKKLKHHFCSQKCSGDFFTGKNNQKYKGGSFCKGYRVICVRDRYIRQHRYVMELKLGRKLRPYEQVHHKNGRRSDNRLKNLELWATYQPCGQRVKDLINFVCKNYREDAISHLGIPS